VPDLEFLGRDGGAHGAITVEDAPEINAVSLHTTPSVKGGGAGRGRGVIQETGNDFNQ